MKLRHAAALALVGWYLMVPPLIANPNPTTGGQLEVSAPLSKWEIVRSFDTAAECNEARQRTAASGVGNAEAQRLWQKYATCIASDDPRLRP